MLAVDDPEAEMRATTQLYWDAVGSGLDDVFDRSTCAQLSSGVCVRCCRSMPKPYSW